MFQIDTDRQLRSRFYCIAIVSLHTVKGESRSKFYSTFGNGPDIEAH